MVRVGIALLGGLGNFPPFLSFYCMVHRYRGRARGGKEGIGTESALRVVAITRGRVGHFRPHRKSAIVTYRASRNGMYTFECGGIMRPVVRPP